jgi:hypothetical protein
MLAPEQDEDASQDPDIVLDGALTGIEFDAYDVPPEDEDHGR